MNPTHLCPECHAALPANAPQGLCPQCLLKAAAGSPPGDIIDIGDPAEVAKCFPQFEIMEMLGRGGMGVVYKARQVQLDRIVALKILPPVEALSADFVARFTREARSLAKLTHANIVAIYDFGESGGLYYFSMEYVDGVNLRTLIGDGKVAPAQALAIVPLVCDALAYAHEEGIVHRDIKPENILLDKKGRVKIADFGLAKLLRREALDMTLTLTGVALGTVRYMAPEQMDKPETVDHRADIYSLGVVIYEMLTGDVPMGRFAAPSETAGVDARLDEIVLHALERDVARRYQHASEIKTDVENVTGRPVAALSSSAPTAASMRSPLDSRFIRPRFSRPAIIGAVWVVFGLLAILSGAFFIALNRVWNGTALPTDLIHERPPLAFTIFMGVLLAIGAGAPIGTIVLGAVAVGRIRRSEGKIVGLPLAVADVLFFPLLVLFVFVMLNTGFNHGWGKLTGYGAIPAAAACFFAARAAWRAISGTGPARSPAGNVVLDPRKKVQAPADTLMLVAGVSMLTALGVAGWLWANTALHPESDFHPGRGQQGVMIIAVSVTLASHAAFIGVAGLLMRRLRARFFVLICVVLAGLFLPAVLALNCIMEAKNIPQWPVFITTWLGMPVGLWAAFVLFREDVREAFAKLAAAPSPDASPGAWRPLEIAAVATTALAFVLGGVNALFDLAQNQSPLHFATLSAIIAAAACSAALMITQQFRQRAIARAGLPGLHFTVLAACTGSLPWTWVFKDITGWNFWHGAAFAALNFVLALVLLISFGGSGAVWRGVATLLAGLAGLALVLWWNAVPVGLIGDRGSSLFNGSGPISITQKPALYGAWTAATLAVLATVAGALQTRRVLAPSE